MAKSYRNTCCVCGREHGNPVQEESYSNWDTLAKSFCPEHRNKRGKCLVCGRSSTKGTHAECIKEIYDGGDRDSTTDADKRSVEKVLRRIRL